ncbi:MAG: hypothetical protein ACFB4I_17515 [Cyanophyceae cyanobacterium]
MAAIKDLTFQQLQDAIGVADAITVIGTAPNETLSIDVSKVTGDSIQALTDTGVLELFAKLYYACRDAQATVNEGQVDGERLNAILDPVTNPVNADTIEIIMQSQVEVPISSNLLVVYGPNN